MGVQPLSVVHAPTKLLYSVQSVKLGVSTQVVLDLFQEQPLELAPSSFLASHVASEDKLEQAKAAGVSPQVLAS